MLNLGLCCSLKQVTLPIHFFSIIVSLAVWYHSCRAIVQCHDTGCGDAGGMDGADEGGASLVINWTA